MRINDLRQIPFFGKCRFVSTFPANNVDILSEEDEIEDIEEFVYHNEPLRIKSEKSCTGYFLAPNYITYVICKVKQMN